ncbi:unnamed protein product [Cylindrotheca closterium]|uniref:Inward rectifier potassium channel C-terminal domain-containing protein n=1 Tax=Cylindrotheca closterium TaxID=2856 RepID=A0AAD2CQX0_9STRA|nr:unnamed protein product [Cylindrotheca closterium]
MPRHSNSDDGTDQQVPTGSSPQDQGLITPLLSHAQSIRQTSSLRQRRELSSNQRLLDRDATFSQSHGRWGVQRLSRLQRRWCLSRIWNDGIFGDWFHRLAYQKTWILMGILFVTYASMVVFFAFVYLGVSILGSKTEVGPDGSKKVIAFCHMDINNHMEALYFSLSTMTTIGYGVSDYYFGGCWTPLLLVLWQVCCAITFDAVAVGLLFHRISRGTKRGKNIIFSDKAAIQQVNGVWHFMFRMGELRQYHLIEATVRCYCVKHERWPLSATNNTIELNPDAATNDNPNSSTEINTTYFVSRQMKLKHPDEEYGSHLWMGLPQVIVHRMDSQSPLVPSSQTWYDEQGMEHSTPSMSPQEDEEQGSNTTIANSLEDFWWDRNVEVVVLVQGVDEATGATTQARHSYKASDLRWNHTFVSCIRPAPRTTRRSSTRQSMAAEVDFSSFHGMLPAPIHCQQSPFIPPN